MCHSAVRRRTPPELGTKNVFNGWLRTEDLDAIYLPVLGELDTLGLRNPFLDALERHTDRVRIHCGGWRLCLLRRRLIGSGRWRRRRALRGPQGQYEDDGNGR